MHCERALTPGVSTPASSSKSFRSPPFLSGPLQTCRSSHRANLSGCKPASLSQRVSRRVTVLLGMLPASEELCLAQVPPADCHTQGLPAAAVNRRCLLLAGLAAFHGTTYLAVAGPSAAGAAEPTLLTFASKQQGYRIQRPAAWDQTGKAGADVLFVSPKQKSTTLGITVSPVRINGLQQFGDAATVGERLLNVERNKDGFISVAMISEGSRTSPNGMLLYDYEYELDSTRGRKRILSTVAIADKKLFIVNGTYKCEAGRCEDEAVDLMRRAAQSFDVGK